MPGPLRTHNADAVVVYVAPLDAVALGCVDWDVVDPSWIVPPTLPVAMYEETSDLNCENERPYAEK